MKTRKNAIVEHLNFQIPVTQLKGPKGVGDMQAEKRDCNAPPTPDLKIWIRGRQTVLSDMGVSRRGKLLLGQSIGIVETNRFQLKFISRMKIVGVRVSVAYPRNKLKPEIPILCLWLYPRYRVHIYAFFLALRKKLTNLHAKSQISSFYSFQDDRVHSDGQTDGHGYIDSARDPDQECVYFLGSVTLPSACYILSAESSIVFYSSSNGYKNRIFCVKFDICWDTFILLYW